jgi:hypothetical protein
MTALAADRLTYTAVPGLRDFPVAAGVVIYEGALVAFDTSGFARPARVSTTDIVIGIAFQRADNSFVGNVAGGIRVHVRDNDIAFVNCGTAGDAIAIGNVGALCYVLDDQTVTTVATAHCVAGNIYWVDEAGRIGVKFIK